MKKSEVLDRFSRVPLFSGCSKRELADIAGAAKEIEQPAGTVLATEGDPGVGFFLIVEGEAKVTIGGRSRGRMGPGDFFGEISLIDGGPRTATVTAEAPVRMLGLTAWVFRRLIVENPAIAPKLLQAMAARLRAAPKAAVSD